MKIIELIIDAFSCSADLNNPELLEKILCEASSKVRAKVVKMFKHSYTPIGVSVILLLAESHISIYTWPEYNYAAIEIFLCNEQMDPNIVWQHIRAFLRPKSSRTKKFVRSIESRR